MKKLKKRKTMAKKKPEPEHDYCIFFKAVQFDDESKKMGAVQIRAAREVLIRLCLLGLTGAKTASLPVTISVIGSEGKGEA